MQLTYPGVYREEIPQRQRSVQQVTTAIFAVTGYFERGPVEDPRPITSPAELERIFGGVNAKSTSATQVLAFFLNGGGIAYINRVLGAGAQKAKASFTKAIKGEVVTPANGGGSTTAISYTPGTLGALPMRPGSVRIRLDEQVDETGEVLGSFSGGATSVFGTISNRLIVPGSVSLDIDSNTYTDDGAGVIENNLSVAVGSINYQTGAVSLTVPALSGPDSLTADYTYWPSVRVLSEQVGTGKADQRVYWGKLSNENPIGDVNNNLTRFTWFDTLGAAKSARVDAVGNITGDGTGFLGGDGVFWLNTGNLGVQVNAVIDCQYWYKTFAFQSNDNGLGSLTGALGTFTVDYETGEVTGTTVATDAVGAAIVLDYLYEIIPVESRHPGLSANDIRVSLFADENSLSNTNAQYSKFNLSVLEERDGNNAFALADQINGVSLSDALSRDYYPTRVNDTFLGSTLIVAPLEYTTSVPDALEGGTKTANVVDRGNGTTRAIRGQLHLYGGRGVVPGSVTITFTSGGNTLTVTDDGLGSITGLEVDGSALSSIDYDTGEFLFTPLNAPDVSTNVTAAYLHLSTSLSVTSDLSGGTDGAALTRNDLINPSLMAQQRGIYALDKVNELMTLAAPDFPGDFQVDQALLAYAESREDSMVLLVAPEGSSAQRAINYKRNVLASNSARGAMYHSWVVIEDPITNRAVTIPPFGHVAGVWAKTDRNRTVGKAPAGTVDGALTFLLGFASDLTAAEVGQLTAAGINALWKPQPTEPRCVWGARTMNVGGEYQYINKRRTVDFVSVSVQRSAWWVVFEDNDGTTRNLIRNQIAGFLRDLWSNGILKGATVNEAFFVVCDATNNPREVELSGQLIVDYGVKTRDVAEFVRLRHRQIA